MTAWNPPAVGTALTTWPVCRQCLKAPQRFLKTIRSQSSSCIPLIRSDPTKAKASPTISLDATTPPQPPPLPPKSEKCCNGQATLKSSKMGDYFDPPFTDHAWDCPTLPDFGINFNELASGGMIRYCEQMEDIYPPGLANTALEAEEEPEEVKVKPEKENIQPSPPTSPGGSCSQRSKAQYTFWPRRRLKHPLYANAVLEPLALHVIERSGTFISEQGYRTPTSTFSGTQRRKSSQQIKAMNPEQRKKEVRQRDRCNSANYIVRKKEKVAGLEKSLKIKEDQLNALHARNVALSSKLNIDPEAVHLLKNEINRGLSKRHQQKLKKKEEAVEKLEAILQEIEVQEVCPEVKKTTLASRKSRTKQNYRTAKLELEVFQAEIEVEKENLVEVELNKIQRKRAFDFAMKLEDSSKICSAMGRHCGAVSVNPEDHSIQLNLPVKPKWISICISETLERSQQLPTPLVLLDPSEDS